MKRFINQFLIAVDQLFNVLFGGWADETLSARAYRRSPESRFWRIAMRVINGLFFWQDHHCRRAWISEVERKHYPSPYLLVSPLEARREETHSQLELSTNARQDRTR